MDRFELSEQQDASPGSELLQLALSVRVQKLLGGHQGGASLQVSNRLSGPSRPEAAVA